MNTLKLKKDIDYKIENGEFYIIPNEKRKFFYKNKDDFLIFEYSFIKFILKNEIIIRMEISVNEFDNFICEFEEINGEGYIENFSSIIEGEELISVELYKYWRLKK